MENDAVKNLGALRVILHITYAVLRSLPKASLGEAKRQSEGGTAKVLLSPFFGKKKSRIAKQSEEVSRGALKFSNSL